MTILVYLLALVCAFGAGSMFGAALARIKALLITRKAEQAVLNIALELRPMPREGEDICAWMEEHSAIKAKLYVALDALRTTL